MLLQHFWYAMPLDASNHMLLCNAARSQVRLSGLEQLIVVTTVDTSNVNNISNSTIEILATARGYQMT